MSVYKLFDTIQFANGELLVQSLRQLGFQVEVGRQLTLRGFGTQQKTVQVAIRAERQAGFYYDWGFAWNGQAFTLIAESMDRLPEKSWDGQALVFPSSGLKFPEQLRTMYSKLSALQFLKQKKAQVRASRTTQDGAVIIRATVEV